MILTSVYALCLNLLLLVQLHILEQQNIIQRRVNSGVIEFKKYIAERKSATRLWRMSMTDSRTLSQRLTQGTTLGLEENLIEFLLNCSLLYIQVYYLSSTISYPSATSLTSVHVHSIYSLSVIVEVTYNIVEYLYKSWNRSVGTSVQSIL